MPGLRRRADLRVHHALDGAVPAADVERAHGHLLMPARHGLQQRRVPTRRHGDVMTPFDILDLLRLRVLRWPTLRPRMVLA